MAAGMPAAPASSVTAAVRGVLMPLVFTGEPKATGPYDEELQRGVLPASELATEPVLLIEPPLGVLAGVMKGEKPPPALSHAWYGHRYLHHQARLANLESACTCCSA